jgi:hypothetical protein
MGPDLTLEFLHFVRLTYLYVPHIFLTIFSIYLFIQLSSIFIMEVHSVVCEVLAGSSYSIVVTIHARSAFAFKHSTVCPKNILLCFVGIS